MGIGVCGQFFLSAKKVILEKEEPENGIILVECKEN
jgi:hypothetical protein